MQNTLLRSVAASALLAVTLGGCATQRPSWYYPVQYYPVSPSPMPYTPAPAAAQDNVATWVPPTSQSDHSGHSWTHDLAAAGAGAGLGIAGTELAKRGASAAAAGTVAGAAEVGEGLEAGEVIDGLLLLLEEDWWLLL